ncbi:MAG: aminotransferase class IV, partial [Pseudomonadota bacterium]
GWPVVVFPERRTTFLGRHKSLNYLFYLAARQYALDQGAKEAIILEADGAVSEGAATSVVYLHKGKLWTPAAASALPGVTVAMLALGLARQKIALREGRTPISRLRQAQGVWLANSLMGLMPVAAINGVAVPWSGHTARLQEALAAMI